MHNTSNALSLNRALPYRVPQPPYQSKRISDLGQCDGFWSRGWVAYPPWGWYRAEHLCQNLKNLIFSKLKWRRTKDLFRSGKKNVSSTRQVQGLDCDSVGCTAVWLKSSGWIAQSPRIVHGLLETLDQITPNDQGYVSPRRNSSTWQEEFDTEANDFEIDKEVQEAIKRGVKNVESESVYTCTCSLLLLV